MPIAPQGKFCGGWQRQREAVRQAIERTDVAQERHRATGNGLEMTEREEGGREEKGRDRVLEKVNQSMLSSAEASLTWFSPHSVAFAGFQRRSPVACVNSGKF
jgi:hypothetical protein